MARSSLLSWKWSSSAATAMRALLDVKQTAIQPMESRPGQISMDEFLHIPRPLFYQKATWNCKQYNSINIFHYPRLSIPQNSKHAMKHMDSSDSLRIHLGYDGISRTKLQASKLRQRVEQTRRGGFPEVLFESLVLPFSVSTQTFQKLKSLEISLNVMIARKWVFADLCRFVISQSFLAATLGYHKWLLKPSECCTFVCNLFFSSWCTSTKYLLNVNVLY